MPARNPHREVRQCRDAERTPHGNGAGRQRDASGVADLQGRSRAWRSASIASPTAFASRKCSPSGCVGRPRDRAGRPVGPSAWGGGESRRARFGPIALLRCGPAGLARPLGDRAGLPRAPHRECIRIWKVSRFAPIGAT